MHRYRGNDPESAGRSGDQGFSVRALAAARLTVSETPELVLVVGANGAGKSTYCRYFHERLPDPFFDADQIAQELGDYNDRQLQRRAALIVARGVSGCLREKRSFGMETTYSGNSRPKLVRKTRDHGYRTQAIFIGTNSPRINVSRVRRRVADRVGHDVADSEIHRRWIACQDNLVRTANFFEHIRLLDNSNDRWIEAGELVAGRVVRLAPKGLSWAENLLSRILVAGESNDHFDAPHPQ